MSVSFFVFLCTLYICATGKLANYTARCGYDYGIPALIYHISTTLVRLIYDFYLLLFPISSVLFFRTICCLLLLYPYYHFWLLFRLFFGATLVAPCTKKYPSNFSRYWCYFNKRLNIFIIGMCVCRNDSWISNCVCLKAYPLEVKCFGECVCVCARRIKILPEEMSMNVIYQHQHTHTINRAHLYTF